MKMLGILFWIKYLLKEIGKFITYYPCTFFSHYIDYFHYNLLTIFDYPIFTVSPASGVIGNKCYGNLWAVKNAVGDDFHKKCMIEHGLYFGEFVLERECNTPSIDTIYTFSSYRKQAILKWFGNNLDKEIITIGPYICYAKHFKSKKKLLEMKKTFGKVLLVFPSHSSPTMRSTYDTNNFISEIDEVAKSFDTVFVSLFWLDIRNGLNKIYEEKGYIVVCSGIRSDRWFLSRQKDLFFLADMSMSNSVGTHIGYSIAMNVPHYVYRQTIKKSGKGVEFSKEKYNSIREEEFDEITSAFNNKAPKITRAQRDLILKYWGSVN